MGAAFYALTDQAGEGRCSPFAFWRRPAPDVGFPLTKALTSPLSSPVFSASRGDVFLNAAERIQEAKMRNSLSVAAAIVSTAIWSASAGVGHETASPSGDPQAARNSDAVFALCVGCGNGNGNGNVGTNNGNSNGNSNTGGGNGNGNGNGNGAPQTNGNLGFMNGGTGNIGSFNGLGNSSSTSGNNNIGSGNGNLNGSTNNGNGNVGFGNGNFNGLNNVGTGNGSNNGNGNAGALNGNNNGSNNQ